MIIARPIVIYFRDIFRLPTEEKANMVSSARQGLSKSYSKPHIFQLPRSKLAVL